METYIKIRNDFLLAAVILAVCQWSYSTWLTVAKDATDGETRSGVYLRIDHETGLHYLEGARGGLTPRLDVNGQQMRQKPRSHASS